MKTEEIAALVFEIAKKLKNKGGKLSDCDWHGTYMEQKELCDYISVHAQLNKFPEKMMRQRAPNETDAELQYRKDNFEPITMPYWYRAVSSIIGRIFSEQNYRITFEDKEVEEYFLKEYPIYGSIIEYFKSIVSPYKINDANAVLALKIGELPTYIDNEEVKIDTTVPPEAALQIYGCEKIVSFKPQKYALFLSDEKSKVTYYNKEVEEGIVFILYDTENIYKIKQIGEKTKWIFESTVTYTHGLDYLPVWKLKGIPKQQVKDTASEPVYYSYFIPAVPKLNKALKQDSSLDTVITKCAFPIRVYYEQECDEPTCSNGKVEVWKGEGDDSRKVFETCQKCNGTGRGGQVFSPMRDYVMRPPKKNITDEEVQLPFPALTTVSPDTAILDFLEEKVKNEIIEAFTFINIDVSNKGDNTGDQTGIEVKIDREELFAFLKHFASEVYALLENGMKAIYQVRWMQEEAKFTVKAPQTFEIYNASELTRELGEAKKSGIPDIALKEMTKDYMAQRFAQNPELVKITGIVFDVDGYATKDTTEIAILKSNNLISLWQAVLHEEIYQFIDRLRSTYKDFLDWELEKQRTELENMAKARAAELIPNTAANIVDSLATESAEGGGIGKIPLGLQQLGLARERAMKVGDKDLSKRLGAKSDDLLDTI